MDDQIDHLHDHLIWEGCGHETLIPRAHCTCPGGICIMPIAQLYPLWGNCLSCETGASLDPRVLTALDEETRQVKETRQGRVDLVEVQAPSFRMQRRLRHRQNAQRERNLWAAEERGVLDEMHIRSNYSSEMLTRLVAISERLEQSFRRTPNIPPTYSENRRRVSLRHAISSLQGVQTYLSTSQPTREERESLDAERQRQGDIELEAILFNIESLRANLPALATPLSASGSSRSPGSLLPSSSLRPRDPFEVRRRQWRERRDVERQQREDLVVSTGILTEVRNPTGDPCSICTDDLPHEDDPTIRLTCGHEFGRSCILTWLNRANTCPSCRENVFADYPALSNLRNDPHQWDTPEAYRSPAGSDDGRE